MFYTIDKSFDGFLVCHVRDSPYVVPILPKKYRGEHPRPHTISLYPPPPSSLLIIILIVYESSLDPLAKYFLLLRSLV